jgi:hypothetical protein
MNFIALFYPKNFARISPSRYPNHRRSSGLLSRPFHRARYAVAIGRLCDGSEQIRQRRVVDDQLPWSTKNQFSALHVLDAALASAAVHHFSTSFLRFDLFFRPNNDITLIKSHGAREPTTKIAKRTGRPNKIPRIETLNSPVLTASSNTITRTIPNK